MGEYYKMMLELTDICNLECGHCLNEDQKHGHMPIENAKRIINFCKKEYGLFDDFALTISGGEISLYPPLKELVHYAAEKSVPLHIKTNGIFAEKRRITEEDMNLPYRKINDIFLNRLQDIVRVGATKDDLIEEFWNQIGLSDSLLEIIEEHIPLTQYRRDVNAHHAVAEFSDWVQDLNVEMKDGRKVIQQIEFGTDKWHSRERKKKGYAIDAPMTMAYYPQVLTEKLGVKIRTSQGEFPAFVGRAKNFKNFSRSDPLNRLIPFAKEEKIILENQDSPFFPETLEDLMNHVYNTNWKFPEDRDVAYTIKKRMGMCGCIHQNIFTVKPDFTTHACGYGVFPPVRTSDAELNDAFFEMREIFNNGGPLAIARHAGMPEPQVYETFMDKGPCGLCRTGMEYNKK